MNPKSIKNPPAYLVLAYAIQWDLDMDDSVDAAEGVVLPSYVLLDLCDYERPEVLGEDGINEVVCDLLSDMYDFCVTGLKIKVIEA
jgi:hypothetical protein